MDNVQRPVPVDYMAADQLVSQSPMIVAVYNREGVPLSKRNGAAVFNMNGPGLSQWLSYGYGQMCSPDEDLVRVYDGSFIAWEGTLKDFLYHRKVFRG